METQESLRYPIGRFVAPEPVTDIQVGQWIDAIEALPGLLSATVQPLTGEQLATPYRPGGWTVRQVVHHLADSHLNSICRFKWALTEERPTIKTYEEARWAELVDSGPEIPLSLPLELLAALHRRWLVLLRGLTPEQLAREFLHPDSGAIDLRTNIGVYAWHGQHHLAHITNLIARSGW